MKKVLTLALGATMLMGTGMGVAHAQGAASGPFADVPTDHWAYTSVEKLRDAGIVIGYPDQTYGGKRAMTRYEFATAIARLLALIPKPVDVSGFAMKSDIPSLSGYATTDSVNAALANKADKSDLTALSNDLNNKLQQNQAALDALKALVNQFEPELKSLGVDVAAVKASLADIEARLAAVEAEQQRVRIEGDASFIARSNVQTNTGIRGTVLPVDQNGYRIGTPDNRSIFDSPSVYHDILLNIYGKVSNTSQAVIKIDAGNYLPWLVSATSEDPNHGGDINGEPDATTFNIYEAYLTTPVALGPLSGAEAKVGRFGTQFTQYVWKAVDPDVYTYRPETDSGDIIGDGAAVNFGIAGAHVQTFAEKNAVQNFVVSANGGLIGNANAPFHRAGSGTGTPTASLGGSFAQNAIDQSAGARITIGNPDNLVLGIDGIVARTDDTTELPGVVTAPGAATNTGVYGADLEGLLPFFKSAGITIDAQAAVDTIGSGSKLGNVNSNGQNQAWEAQLGWAKGNFSIKGGYTQVYSNFEAPGYWGRLGSWTNPANVEGGLVSASYAFSHKLKLSAEGNLYNGIQNNLGLTPLQKENNLYRFAGGLSYGLTSSYNVDLGYEWVQYNLKNVAWQNTQGAGLNPGVPTEQYITIGVGHDLSKNSSLKLLYQIINYNDDKTNFDNNLGDNTNGGVAITQFTMKF